jgi:hypothetical protein
MLPFSLVLASSWDIENADIVVGNHFVIIFVNNKTDAKFLFFDIVIIMFLKG